MEAIKFAEWLAENHYSLHNIIIQNGTFVWRSESDNYKNRTSEELYQMFLKDAPTK